MDRHEIPTHLNVEDKAFAGLTMRQLMTAAIGLALAYGAVSEPPLPVPVRLIAAGLVLAAVALLALWRPREVPVRVDETIASYEVVVPEPIWMDQAPAGEGSSGAAFQ